MSKHTSNPGAKGAVPAEEEKVPAGEVSSQGGGEVPAEKTGEPDPGATEKRIAELEAKLAEAGDNYLRKAADFENYRKRMVREKQDAIDYANQTLLLDLIHIMDDFELALKAVESSGIGEFKAFYDGFSLIEKRLSTQLENKWGLKRYVSLGQPFDPNFHEAVLMDPSGDAAEPTVAEEYNKGYTLKDRVVRHAKVKVSMPAKQAGGSEPAGGEAGPPEQTG